jgi:hypothetical protein
MPGPTKSWAIRGTTCAERGAAPKSSGNNGFVATVREGRILRMQWFTDRAEALEAAGLKE